MSKQNTGQYVSNLLVESELSVDSVVKNYFTTIEVSSWPTCNLQILNANSTIFLSALLGAILFGWGILIWFMSGTIYNKVPEELRKTVLISVISVFVVDTLGSVLSDNAFNEVANVIILLVLIGSPRRRLKVAKIVW